MTHHTSATKTLAMILNFLEHVNIFTFSSCGDKTISHVYANRVRAVTACHAFRSRAGLQGFRFEIEYQNFDQV